MSRKSQTRTFQSWVFFCYLTLGFVSWGATPEADTVISPAPAPVPQTARELYNAGSRQLQAGKLGDAEALLESSLDQQEDLVQPVALFNLGHVRFAQGTEALKKSPGGVAPQSRRATEAGDEGIRKATEALASSDVAQMVAAYWTGRGARQEMRAATDAVRRAMEAHGKTLAKWRQSLNDFRSAAELRPSDTNAVRNAEIVAQAIARLVDSMREMQQSAAGLSGRQTELKGLLAQLKGRIPGPSQTPGAPGEDGEEGETSPEFFLAASFLISDSSAAIWPVSSLARSEMGSGFFLNNPMTDAPQWRSRSTRTMMTPTKATGQVKASPILQSSA